MKTINDKLATIQTKFKSKKSRFNSFGKYYFRSAEDILEATKPYLLELGVTVIITEELETSFNFPIIKTTAKIIDQNGAELEAIAIVGVDLDQKGMQMPQRFGSASSYGKKYALGNLFLIDDTQDSDATNSHGNDWVPQAKKYIQEGGSIDKIKQKYKVTPEIEKELSTL
jgi:hypothetical protein